MQIQTPGQNKPPALARPPRENWDIQGQEVDFQADKLVTTADLLAQTDSIPAEGVQATYNFQRDCSRMRPATAGELGMAALRGAGTGAVVGALAGLALNVLGGVIYVFSAGFIKGDGVGLLIPAAFGAVAGAGMNAMDVRAEHKDYPHYGESMNGKLKPEFGPDGKKHLVFHPGGQLESKVDLEEYAKAPVIPGGEPGSSDGQWWQAGYANVEY